MKRIDLNFKVQNRYRLRLFDAESGTLKEDVTIHNTVTDYWKTEILPTFYTSGGNRNLYLFLGTGTEPHTSADTELHSPLFNYSISWEGRYLTHTAGEDFMRFNVTVTLTESQANGDLAELALSHGQNGNQPSQTYSIANFHDSEGQPIVIQKTDTDTLTLDIELQFSLDTSSLPANVLINLQSIEALASEIRFPAYSSIASLPTASYQIAYYSYPSSATYGTLVSWLMACQNFYGQLSLNTNKNLGYCDLSPITKSNGSNLGYTVVDNKRVYRYSWSDIAMSAAGNLEDPEEIYQIKSLGFILNSCGLTINLPDHSIFEPTELEFQIVGDGVTTDFNLPVPLLMQDRGCVVTINDQVMDPSEYDWFGINYQTIQAHDLIDWNHATSCSTYRSQSWGTDHGMANSPYQSTLWMGYGNSYINYHYDEPIVVDCVGRLSNVGVYGTSAIKYSNDGGSSWTTLKQWLTSDTSIGFEQLDDPITASDWRIEANIRSGAGSISTQKTAFPIFGDYATVMTPTIRFHNPIPNEQIVHIKAYTEYPLKSSEWIYKTISIDISKGFVE